MISLPLRLLHGEVMHTVIGLPKFSIVLAIDMIYGCKALHTLEPAYILGDRKHIPEAQNAVESVLRTELLDAIPMSIADACMCHGYCTAELIGWYLMKQLIMPPDINEVTLQKEILTHPKVDHSLMLIDGIVHSTDATAWLKVHEKKA